MKSKIKKNHFEVRRNSTCDERDMAQLANNFLNLSNPKKSNIKSVKLSNQNLNKSNMYKSKLENSFNNSPPKINIINYFNNNNRKNKAQKTKKEKLKNLRFFFVGMQKNFHEN